MLLLVQCSLSSNAHTQGLTVLQPQHTPGPKPWQVCSFPPSLRIPYSYCVSLLCCHSTYPILSQLLAQPTTTASLIFHRHSPVHIASLCTSLQWHLVSSCTESVVLSPAFKAFRAPIQPPQHPCCVMVLRLPSLSKYLGNWKIREASAQSPFQKITSEPLGRGMDLLIIIFLKISQVEGLKSTSWWLQNSHRDVKYSTGNIANTV